MRYCCIWSHEWLCFIKLIWWRKISNAWFHSYVVHKWNGLTKLGTKGLTNYKLVDYLQTINKNNLETIKSSSIYAWKNGKGTIGIFQEFQDIAWSGRMFITSWLLSTVRCGPRELDYLAECDSGANEYWQGSPGDFQQSVASSELLARFAA